MKDKFGRKIFISLIIASLLVSANLLRAEKQKIKIVTESASIRLKADIKSEVIEYLPIGSVFEFTKKVNGYYEIRFPSKVGVMVTGYIHESFVEEVMEAEPKVEPKRELIRRPIQPVTIAEPRKAAPKRGELAIRGGYNFGYSVNETISYSDSFSEGLLQSATSTGTLTQKLGKPLGFDGSFNFYFAEGLGIQLRFDYNSKSKFTEDSVSNYKLNWTWTTGGSGSEEEEWNLEGDVSLMILSANLIYKVQGGGMFAPLFSGGISYFTGKVKANTTGGGAGTWLYYITPYHYIQYIDYWDIPAELDASFSGIGFNIGGGADILFSPNVALNIDARYFLGKKIEEQWEITPGTYDSNINEGWSLTLSQEEAKLMQEDFESFEFKPSFFKISVGLKFLF